MKLPIKFNYDGVDSMILAALIWRIYKWNWVKRQSHRSSVYYDLDNNRMFFVVHDRTFRDGMHKGNVIELFMISEQMTNLIFSGVTSWDDFTEQELISAGRTHYTSTNTAQKIVASDRIIDITLGRCSSDLMVVGG